MIDRTHTLPLKRQAHLVGISRGTVYYHPEPISDADLRLMRRIDKLHQGSQFTGAEFIGELRKHGTRSAWAGAASGATTPWPSGCGRA